jgi:integrase
MAKRRSKGEGSIFFWKTKFMDCAITLPDGRKKRKYSKNQKEVRDWLVDQRKNLKDGLFVDDQKLTVGEFVERWFADVKSPLLRPSTLISHESIIKNHIVPEIGYVRLRDLSPAHLQALYTKRLREGKSKRTVKYIHTIMHQSSDETTNGDWLPEMLPMRSSRRFPTKHLLSH